MRRRLTLIVAGVAALAVLALGGAAIAGATQGDDEGEQTLSGPAAERASAAALRATGGGSVTEVERDPEGGRLYEVEVKKADGSTVDVELDSSFKVVGEDRDKDDGAED